jgi:transposase InsO family protein
MDPELCEEIALFRYGVISELVTRPLALGEKERLLSQIEAQQWQIPGTDRTHIGRSTVRDWIAQYEALGFEGLRPSKRSDAGRTRAIPESVQDLLLQLRHERPKASVRSLIRAVQLSGKVQPTIRLAPSTVHRFLAAHEVPEPESPSAEPDALAFTHPHTGDLWMSDLMHGPRLLVPGRHEGPKSYLYAFLDDATRMSPYSAFYPLENAACFQEAFKQALLRRGIPRRLYVDNGATFKTHHLQVICATLNITLIHSRPHKPRGRGKVERFFRTVRTAFLPHLTDAMRSDLASMNRVFWAWLESEYHQTPHRGLDEATPLDRFMEDHALVRPAPEDLEQLMRMNVTRRVGRDRTVRLQSRLYEAPDGFAGQKVEVLYDPYDPSRPVHFRQPGSTQEQRLRRLDLHTNSTLRRGKALVQPGTDPQTTAPTGISYLELLAKSFYQEDS